MRSTTTLSRVSCWGQTSIRKLTACCTTKKTTSFITLLFFVFLSMGSFKAQATDPTPSLPCEVTNYNPTSNHGMWLPCIPANGHNDWRFASDAPGVLTHYDNGTATFTGRVINTYYTNIAYDLDIHFSDRKDWDEWSAAPCNGQYKDEQGLVTSNENEDWFFYLFDPVNPSTLTLQMIDPNTGDDVASVYNGEILYLNHFPAVDAPDTCPDFGFQVGLKANSKDASFGGATWFTVGNDPNTGSQPVFCGDSFNPNGCHGDFNLDISCDPPLDCISEVVVDCSSISPVELECGSDYDPTVTGTPTVTVYYVGDFCEAPEYTLESDDAIVAGGCVTTVTRTWTVYDLTGEVLSSCDQIITLTDTQAPIIYAALEEDVYYECGDAIPSTDAFDYYDCDSQLDVVVVVNDDALTSCGGVRTITTTITDDCDNMSARVLRVNVAADLDAPFAVFVDPGKTVECDGDLTFQDPVFDDVCNPNNIVVNDLGEQLTENGCGYSITKSWTATDICGNTSDPVSSTIVVNDLTAPDWSFSCQIDQTYYTSDGADCPADAEISLEIGAEITTSTTWFAGGILIPSVFNCVADNCTSSDNLIIRVTDKTKEDLDGCNYVLTITLEAEDECGNISGGFTCTYYFNDNEAPELSVPLACDFPGQTVDANGGCSYQCAGDVPSIEEVADLVGLSDNCDANPTLESGSSLDGDDCYGYVSYWFSAFDACGNQTDQYSVVFMYHDTEAPTYEPIEEELTVNCGEDVPAFSPVWSDNCDTDLTLTCISSIAINPGCDGGYIEMISRSCTAIDNCGNGTTVSQIVYIVDEVAPVITGVAEIDIDCSADELYVLGGNAPSVSDNCDDQPSLIPTYQWYEATCGEQIIVVWNATDQCGNSSAFTQVYTVVDDVAPAMLCDFSSTLGFAGDYAPENWTYTNSAYGNGFVNVDDAPNSITIGVMDITDDYEISQQYSTLVATVVADGAVSFSYEIIAEDNLIPSWDRFGYVLNGVYTELGYGIGNSGNAVVAVQAGDSFGFYIYADDADESNITIASEFMANGNGAYQCGDVIADMPDNLEDFIAGGGYVSDNCEIDPESFTANETSTGSCPEVITRTYTVADLCGNETECVYVITISDDLAPVLVGVPEDMDVECDDVPSIESFIVSAEDCSGVTIETSVVENYDPLMICLFDDANMPGSQQDWSMWLPNFNGFSDNWVVVGSMTLTELPAGAHLTGSIVNATDPTAGFDVDVLFENKRDWTQWSALMTTDNLYNRAAKIFDLGQVGNEYENWDYYEMDNSNAFLNGTGALAGTNLTLSHAPNNLRYAFQVGNGANNVNMDYGFGGWFDVHGTHNGVAVSGMGDFGGGNGGPEFDCEIIPGCYDHTYVYTWTATDDCGNTSSESATLNVVDTTEPVFTDAPADLTLECTDDIPALADCIATDNCTAAENIVYTSSESSDGDACLTTIVRTWTATDLCENTATHTQTITILDTQAPEITDYPADLTVSCYDLVPAIDESLVSATDACNEVTIWAGEDVMTGNTCNATITRTYYALDACDNESSVTQIITVIDDIDPVIVSYPGDVLVNCIDDVPAANVQEVVATDNCNLVTVTYSDSWNNESTCDLVISRTYTATDACGNASSATQFITVIDDIAPVITGYPADVYAECDAVPMFGQIEYSDNCDSAPTVNFSYVTVDGDCPQSYTLVGTWTVTDNCGNTSEAASASIFVSDNTAPTFDQLPVAELNLVDCAEPVIEELTASDNCGDATVTQEILTRSGGCPTGASYEIVYTATDECGNYVQASTFVHVNDQTPPVIVTEAQGGSFECDGNGNLDEYNGWLAIYGGLTATDNCTGVTYSYNVLGTDPGCGGTSTTVVEFIATDECQNSSSSTAAFVIVDTTAPEVTEAMPMTVECEMYANSDAYQAWLSNNGGATASDLCSGATWSNDGGVWTPACGYTGSYLVTFTATDDCGNYAMTTATFTVVDTTDPSIDVEASSETVECSYEAMYLYEDWMYSNGGAQASDLCGYVTWSSNVDEVIDGCGNTSTTVVTFTATDDCGNTSSTTASFTTEDTTNPWFDQLPVAELNLVDCAEPVIEELTASDNCGDATVTQEILTRSGGCPTGASYEIVYTATDECGNYVQASTFVHVNDQTPPVIVTEAQGGSFECDGNGNLDEYNGWLAIYGGLTATDNCTGVTYSYNVLGTDPGCGGTSTTVVEFIATDECGNASSSTATFTIIDTTAPVITEAMPMTVECGGQNILDDLQAWLDNNGGATASDLCSGAEWSYNVGEFMDACGNTGYLEVTFTATDDCGNYAMTTATFTVVDTTAPTIDVEAMDQTVECDYEAMYAYDDWLMYNGNASASDLCGEVVWSYMEVDATEDCGNTGSSTVTFTATDECGNSASTTATFTVIDTTDPVWEVAPILDIYLYDCVEASFNTPSAYDNCGSVTITYVDLPRSGGCPTGISYERVFTATDECGNSIQASTYVHINDLTPPSIDEDANDMTVECDGSGNGAAYQEWLANNAGFEASDNCSDVIITSVVSELEGCSEFTGGYHVVFTATDACGNQASSDANFYINDTTDPVLVGVPDNILDPVECDQIPAPAMVSADDLCGTASVSMDQTYEYGDESMCNYAIIRTWTATDECGNTSMASQTINVADNTAPVFDGTVADVTIECSIDEIPAPEQLTGTDNCMTNLLVASVSDEYIDGGCPVGQSIERTYTLTDNCGNTATQVQIITIEDTTDPMVYGPENAMYSCIDDVPAGSAFDVDAYDACTSVTVTLGEVISPNGCNYDITRTWTVTDECGNSATHVQQITVIDDVAPVINYGPQDMTVACANLVPAANTDLIDADDNCSDVSVTVADVFAGNSCEATVTRTYTATDACGNSSIHVQVITIHDDVAPEIVSGPENLAIQCYDDVPAIDLGSIIATDNCQVVGIVAGDVIDGNECVATITRTYTVSDGCGNSSEHVQVITVNDNTAPVITEGPENMTVACADEIPAADISLIVASDNCSDVTVTVAGELVGNDCVATMTRVYTATDACGNASTHVQVISVVDDVDPVIMSGPVDAAYQCVSDVPAPGDDLLASDNCGDVTLGMTELVDGPACNQTITRTWIAYDGCQNASEPWVQVISVMDDTAPELVGLPEDIDIECGSDIPAPADVWAMDNCSGELETTFVEVDNAPENPPCILETPFGQGGSWALWLPQLASSELSAFWVFDANGGVFTEFIDGTATISGNVVNTLDPASGFDINITLEDKKDWDTWHNGSNNGNYKDDFGFGAAYYETWSYYVIANTSTLVGSGDLVGSTLNLTHAPANLFYGFQVGIAANNNNANYGGGGWFDYTGTVNGNSVNGNGDVAFDGECIPCDYSILRTWTAIDECGNEVSHTQTINVTNTPEAPIDVDALNKPQVQDYAMLASYPNPFIDKNNVEFEITEDANVILSVYNADGRLIQEMFRGSAQAHQTYKFEFNAINLPTGVYIYKLITPNEILVERVVLTR